MDIGSHFVGTPPTRLKKGVRCNGSQKAGVCWTVIDSLDPYNGKAAARSSDQKDAGVLHGGKCKCR